MSADVWYNTGMEKIVTSFCTFEMLVRRYTYVDKTELTLGGINFRTAKRNIDEPVMESC